MVDGNPLWEADTAAPKQAPRQPSTAPAEPAQQQRTANRLWDADASPAAVAAKEVATPAFMDTERPPAQDMSWSEVGQKAAQSFVPSLKQYGESLITPFTQPKETLAALGQIGTGAVSKAKGALGFEQDAAKKEEDEAAINALGRFYADRYGSVAGFKRALAEDPVGVMSDLSLPISGGGAALAKAPGTIGKIGSAVQTTGRIMDPIGAATMAPKAATEAATTVAAIPASWFTGASMKGLKSATEAGFTANPVFWQHFNGAGKAEDMVEAVNKAISDAGKARASEYMQGMDKLKLSQPLSYENLNKAMEEARNIAGTKGRVSNPEAFAVFQELNNRINNWTTNKATTHTLSDFDELKKLIRNVGYEKTSPGSPARKVVDTLADSVSQTIKDFDPGYADVMKRYEAATKQLNDFRKGLTGSDTASSFRKLMSAQKGHGKENILEEISKINPEIPFMIAGQELRPWLAQGLRGLITSGSALGTGLFMGVPHAAAHLYGQSPKAVGATFYGAGRIGGAPDRLYKALPPGSFPAAQQIGRAENLVGEEEEDQPAQVVRQARASGGRAMGIMTAERLMRAAHAAKLKINKSTEQILDEPDEAVVKALDIANRHI